MVASLGRKRCGVEQRIAFDGHRNLQKDESTMWSLCGDKKDRKRGAKGKKKSGFERRPKVVLFPAGEARGRVILGVFFSGVDGGGE